MMLSRMRHRFALLRGIFTRLRLGRLAIGTGLWLARDAELIATCGGRLRIGKGTAVQSGAVVRVRDGSLEIGEGSFIGRGTMIVACDAISIGRDALIAEYVTIRDQDHAFGGPEPTARNGFVTAPIKIGDNVWLGAKVTVLKGVKIGDNVVVAANSVVSRDLPDGVIAAGAPAMPIRKIKTRVTCLQVTGDEAQ